MIIFSKVYLFVFLFVSFTKCDFSTCNACNFTFLTCVWDKIPSIDSYSIFQYFLAEYFSWIIATFPFLNFFFQQAMCWDTNFVLASFTITVYISRIVRYTIQIDNSLLPYKKLKNKNAVKHMVVLLGTDVNVTISIQWYLQIINWLTKIRGFVHFLKKFYRNTF